MVKDPLGHGHNKPVATPGMNVRSSSRLRKPLCKGSSTRRCARPIANPKGHIIVDKSVWGMLPDLTWGSARTRINELFRKAGGLQASYVKTLKDLPRLNLIDSVVECFWNKVQASWGFRFNVYNSLNRLSHKNRALKRLATIFNQPSHYSVSEGRSYAAKGIFVTPPLKPQLVCVTYGVIVVERVLNLWRGGGSLLNAKPLKPWTLKTIKSAPQAEQISLGVVLGNLIAHEIRHQMLGLSKTGSGIVPVHDPSGLGKDGANFWKPKIKFDYEKPHLLGRL